MAELDRDDLASVPDGDCRRLTLAETLLDGVGGGLLPLLGLRDAVALDFTGSLRLVVGTLDFPSRLGPGAAEGFVGSLDPSTGGYGGLQALVRSSDGGCHGCSR